MENFNIVWHYKDLLLKGLGYTVFVSVAAILIALCVGMLLSVMRMGGDSLPSRILKKIVAVYISFVRGTPVLVQIYIIYQALAVMGLNLSNLASGIIALSLNSGGFIAEIIRGGLTAIPKGQFEASYAMGMSRFKTMVRIIFPQTLKIIVPSLTGQFVQTVKDSSILSIITVAEMTMMTKEAIGITFSPLIVYICAGVLYWALNLVIEFASRCIEKHNNRVAI